MIAYEVCLAKKMDTGKLYRELGKPRKKIAAMRLEWELNLKFKERRRKWRKYYNVWRVFYIAFAALVIMGIPSAGYAAEEGILQ